jgi:hypothetical protein
MTFDRYQLCGAIGLVTSEAVACGTCGAPHYMFINRGGSTRCALCDARALATDPRVAEVATHFAVAQHFEVLERA